MAKQVETILVTGADGQLGQSCGALTKAYPQARFLFAGKAQLSITDREAVLTFFKEHKPDACINAAAYTKVDLAESEKELAFSVNADAVGYLAEACAEQKATLIHFSTDYVFNGMKAEGYHPDDETDPINIYGASKRKGEELALAHNPDTLIFRTSWVYSPFGQNFVKTMMRLMKERSEIRVVADQTGRPTYAPDLARFIMDLLMKSDHRPPGCYHYANKGAITWHTFATAIRDLCGLDCAVIPITSAEFPTPARRPHFSILNTERTEQCFGIQIPDWTTGLATCLHQLREPNERT